MLNIPDTLYFAPSGQSYDRDDLSLMRRLARNKSIQWTDREETFHSGFKCNVYVRMRNDLTDNVPLLFNVGDRIKHFVIRLKRTHGPQYCLIGIPTAGTPLAQAAAMRAYDPFREHESRICFRQLRVKLKQGHGKDDMWAGPPDLRRHSYVTIENVVSTAKAYLEHLEHLEQDGYPTKEMHHVAFADWQLGGTEALDHVGYQSFAMYQVLDMIAALVHLGDWPQEYFEETSRRVRQWRLEKGLSVG